MLVPAMDAADVTQMDRRTVCCLREDGGVDVGQRAKFTRLLEGQLPSFGVDRPGRHGRVAALQDFSDCRGNDPERGQAVLRIARLDLFLTHPSPGTSRG